MKKYIITSICISVLFSSCEKFLDVNENENEITEETVTLQLLLPSSQAAIAHAVGNNLQVFGGIYSQFWTQSNASSQYKTIEQYAPDATDFDNPWRILYADALKDLSIIEKKAAGSDAYIGISKILQAYTYQLLTDNFGTIPFSEALDATIVNPKYDSQEQVYNGIFSLINDGRNLILNASTGAFPGEDDLIFNGDLVLWIEFANTLQLRAALRLSEINPSLAQSQIANSAETATTFGIGYLFPEENAAVGYSGAGGNSLPLNAEIIGYGGTENLRASKTTFDYYDSVGDTLLSRKNALYKEGAALPQGAYNLPVGPNYAVPSDITGANNNDEAAVGQVLLISGAESMFLQAEAVARGWLDASLFGSDADLYFTGISANYAYLGIAEDDFLNYVNLPAIALPSDLESKIERIITEKWAAMCGLQGIEAWAEWRRTSYPDFFQISANSLTGSQFPGKLLYPSTEVTRNANFPGQLPITEKVWWDNN